MSLEPTLPNSKLKPILPNPPRWQPNPDPSSIVIPGLDTNAPITDQIEQVEQFITLKLQDIDENFSKIHAVLANRILPAVKRYAANTEPIREAAKFWTSFYEEAAQIKIPTYEDFSSLQEDASQSQQDEAGEVDEPEVGTTTEAELTMTQTDSTPLQTQEYDSSIRSTESSFMPGQAAFSSTPATATRHRIANSQVGFSSGISDDPSWAASLESPLVRLNRDIKNFTLEEDEQPTPSTASHSNFFSEPSIIRQDSVKMDKGKGKAPDVPEPFSKTKALARQPDQSTFDKRHKTPALTPRRSQFRKLTSQSDELDDSFDGLQGMSPPVSMSPALPRSVVKVLPLKLGKTPVKSAVQRIKQDLINSIESPSTSRSRIINSKLSRVESTMSTIPTPPSIPRYVKAGGMDSLSTMADDPSLENMMRKVGLNLPLAMPTGSSSFSQKGPIFGNAPSTEEDNYSDSDSLDEVNNTAHPSAAFLMASQGTPGSDDSFGSNPSSDSLDTEGVAEGLEPVHPFALANSGNEFDDDDSYDDENFDSGPQEETLFGVPPVQRMRQASGVEPFRMLGEGLMEDTIGIGARIARSGQVEDTPTPAPWGTSTRNLGQ